MYQARHSERCLSGDFSGAWAERSLRGSCNTCIFGKARCPLVNRVGDSLSALWPIVTPGLACNATGNPLRLTS